jgi:lysozyme
MKLSAAGLELLKRAEGFRSHTYLDVGGRATIGYGHLLGPHEVFSGEITLQQAEAMLERDLVQAEEAVTRLVRVPLTQGQFDALVDFTFNLGAERLRGSTLLAKLNAGDANAAAAEILRWDHAGAKEVAGLKLRREAEYRLWMAEASRDAAA